ncbi:hypothetical protein FOZ63_005685, partial [Perkinsus olseni]
GEKLTSSEIVEACYKERGPCRPAGASWRVELSQHHSECCDERVLRASVVDTVNLTSRLNRVKGLYELDSSISNVPWRANVFYGVGEDDKKEIYFDPDTEHCRMEKRKTPREVEEEKRQTKEMMKEKREWQKEARKERQEMRADWEEIKRERKEFLQISKSREAGAIESQQAM